MGPQTGPVRDSTRLQTATYSNIDVISLCAGEVIRKGRLVLLTGFIMCWLLLAGVTILR
jgi:hypothetical protein